MATRPMKRFLLVLAVLGLGGCGQDAALGPADLGPRILPDGHLQTACLSNFDCDDIDDCTVDACLGGQCSHTPKDCTDLNSACAVGQCTRDRGRCEAVPVPDATECVTTLAEPGHCSAGSCLAAPKCASTGVVLTCTIPPRTGTTAGSSALDTYACAAGETGPEIAYAFRTTTDRSVTLLLDATVDLDLIVLEGKVCSNGARCAGSSLTAGSGKESVTFDAKAATDYTVVVEGRDSAVGTFTLTTSCAGCAAIQALGCNQTLLGDTTGPAATDGLHGYACAPSQPGPEDSYTLVSSVATEYRLGLTNLTQDLDLFVLYGLGANQCNPGACRVSSQTAGSAGESVDISTAAGETAHVVVDSPGAGGPYQLEVSCAPSCRGASQINCLAPSDMRRNDDPSWSKNLIDRWGACATGLTGPELAYSFVPSATGVYTFTLSGLTADLDLVVLSAGTTTACNPLNACLTSSVTAGNADETVQFTATAGQRYWIAVDGRDGAVSSYSLQMRSPACPSSCYQSSNGLSCTYREDRRRNDDRRGRNMIDRWACDADTTGPEVVYAFKPPASGMYTVTLDGLSADLDLIVLENATPTTCNPTTACFASSVTAGTNAESVTFAADSAKYYWIAVDGKAGAVSPYRIHLDSASCPAPECWSTFYSFSCGVTNRTTSASNDYSGATNDVSAWSCGGGALEGPEFTHEFLPTGTGPFTIEMLGLKANLDLLVIETSGLTCDPTARCAAQSRNAGTANERVTFAVDPTKTYWVIADGVDGAVSSYSMSVTDGCGP